MIPTAIHERMTRQKNAAEDAFVAAKAMGNRSGANIAKGQLEEACRALREAHWAYADVWKGGPLPMNKLNEELR